MAKARDQNQPSNIVTPAAAQSKIGLAQRIWHMALLLQVGTRAGKTIRGSGSEVAPCARPRPRSIFDLAGACINRPALDLAVSAAYHDDGGTQQPPLRSSRHVPEFDLHDQRHPVSAEGICSTSNSKDLFVEVESLRKTSPASMLANQFLQLRRSAHAPIHPASCLLWLNLQTAVESGVLMQKFLND